MFNGLLIMNGDSVKSEKLEVPIKNILILL